MVLSISTTHRIFLFICVYMSQVLSFNQSNPSQKQKPQIINHRLLLHNVMMPLDCNIHNNHVSQRQYNQWSHTRSNGGNKQ
ncbi:hypothetical protein VIGAN_09098500 [Vigna angularis var. angularis]|uniref:Uncharacterized protein n=1 Tax=Vigna angularis var. angularis TaxID=157739 RepID=A0A0S3SX98_PHAAN|nr:hypothetical protein VIGAN_09098500 [Vigna angularis var. angularis]